MYDLIGKAAGQERLHRMLAKLLGAVPEEWLLGLMHGIGFGLYVLAGKKGRGHIERNMRDVLGMDDARHVRRLGREYFINLAVTLYEILIDVHRLPRLHAAGRLERRFEAEGERLLADALRLGRGAIVYTPHMGNFFYAYWYLTQKYDCLAVVTAQSPELRPIYLKFQAIGCRGLDYDETPPLQMIRKLRNHLAAGGVVFLLGDFYRPAFPEATMFGRPTRSPDGAASFGIEQHAPIVPLYTVRKRPFRHRLVFETPVLLHERFAKHERRAATNELNRFLESAIRAAPSHWFYWFNAEERWNADDERLSAQEREARN
ncbi:lysophospholipid acyltransferase family protein [Gordoniibacillus kamchatkensis]|uniref:lysophospholipid acyltransferase family protein n=1 Tax=Gordoniibacillus kamchatkensis TaxID=1590651 RepID=UPI000698B2CB|nr:lysophospholipid acyltransferase family protein [Paenibacillus sp. VKM B-2647]